MLKLLHLHWVVNRRMLWQLTPLWALWIHVGLKALRQGTDGGLMFTALSFFFGATLMAIFALQGLNAGAESFLLALPIRRRVAVDSTYVVAGLAGAAGSLIPFAAAPLTGHRIPEGAVLAALQLFLLLMLGLLVFLPLRFRFGSTQGATAFAGLLIAGMTVLHLWHGLPQALLRLAELASTFSQLPWPWHAGGLLILALLAAASLGLARRAYAQQTF